MASYNKGLRGAPDHMIYDFENMRFQPQTSWNEYGVGASQDIGVIAESSPAWWMAEWKSPVESNLMLLSGC